MQLLNKDLELNQQRLAAEEAEQKLKETEFKNISAQQQGSIQKLTLENQLKQQQQLRTWLIVGSALLALLLGFIIWNNRQLRFQNIALQAALLEGQTTERKRVAADLHDALGSTLSSLRWSIGAIDKNKLEPKQQEVYQHVQSTIEQAYDQVRLLSHNLLPEELEKQGLWKALEMLIKKLNRNTPVTFSLQLPDNPAQLNSKTEFELYSICLELINNILKHAHATEASISFTQLNGQFKLTVSDNGKGITKHTPKGKGQHNIDERVQTLGGQRYIISNENGLTNEVVFSA
ncbi:histidine kinase [Runella sp. MFBS21]|uniref:sensor histidine kinase n=1 Tax=Runella sp. MFBS21 TaxID=3034018 RepID=UPI0023F72E54|nr:histidine kinase [Runella sp. MFBS21]MDF7818561.1 histidine kinase [Runella sp. MFBS21]